MYNKNILQALGIFFKNYCKPSSYSKDLQIFTMSYHKKHRRPPGLRGKEIGMYYKSLQIEKTKTKNKSWVRFINAYKVTRKIDLIILVIKQQNIVKLRYRLS